MPTSFAEASEKCRSYIAQNVKLTYPSTSGSSLQEELNKFKKEIANKESKATPSMLNAMKKQLEENQPIHLSSYESWLVNRFKELNLSRSYNEQGPNPLSYSEIICYADAVGESLESIEVQILKEIDSSYTAAIFEEREKGRT